MSSESITLSDGRSLGYCCLGDPDGQPLFFFHGTPGSRLTFSEEDPIAKMPGVRLITPERPGYGISDPKANRTLMDWADDVAELAGRLGILRFAVGGESGGAPHALACASRLPDHVTVALLLSSPSPAGFQGVTRGMSMGNRLGLWIGRVAPWLVGRMIQGYASMFENDPEGFVDAMARQMALSDRELLLDVSRRQAILRDLREAYRQGSTAQAVDAALAMTSSDWGFELGHLKVPVYLWHGEEDRLVSMPMAEYLKTEIPACKACFVPKAGHLLTEYPEVIEQMRRVLLETRAG